MLLIVGLGGHANTRISHIHPVGNKGRALRRTVPDNVDFQSIQIGQIRLKIIRILHVGIAHPGHGFFEHERSRAHLEKVNVLAVGACFMLGLDHRIPLGQNGEEGSLRGLHMRFHRMVIHHFEAAKAGKPAGDDAALRIEHFLKTIGHISGGKGCAIMPLDIFVQIEGVELAIRAHLPALGQVANNILAEKAFFARIITHEGIKHGMGEEGRMTGPTVEIKAWRIGAIPILKHPSGLLGKHRGSENKSTDQQQQSCYPKATER